MKKVRIGVLGGYRGNTMIKYCKGADNAEVVAICDKVPEVLEAQRRNAEGLNIAFYDNFDAFIQHDMDAVVLANYANEHAPFAIKALKRGLHVFSEVLPCQTMKEAVELGNHHAAFMLYKCYRENIIEPEYKTSAKHYLYKAADMGDSAAEYILGKELITKNPDKAKEYLLSSANKNNPQSMYLLGKVLLDEGKKVEALKWLDTSARLDLWNMMQVGLMYYYSLGERERGVELLRTAASDGYSSAKKALQAIEDGGDAQILCQCLWLFAYVSDIIEEETDKQTVRYDAVDSKLRREIAQKKRGGPVMRM